ncbi:MAG: hypothetical protein E7Z89_07055 [Cyanobacteria bacterium SIG28]|nr:hypothetical protein [Cyanobacteria bacterium SIG28]
MKMVIKFFKIIFSIINTITLIPFVLFVIGIIVMLIISSDPMDACMDVGYCKEGLPLNIEGKKITVNKQTCIENDGKWLEDRKVCKFN